MKQGHCTKGDEERGFTVNRAALSDEIREVKKDAERFDGTRRQS